MRLRTICLAALAALLAACSTPTPYVPAGTEGDRYGYTEQQIEGNRFRVAFAGNTLTDRQTVENYLLYRAAELTLAWGADYFVIVNRDIDTDTTWHTSYNGWPYYWPSPYRDPYRAWGPGFGPSPWVDGTTRAVTRYDAHAEIMIRAGRKPTDDARAFDARQVIGNLGPTIVRLKPQGAS